jgi:hypothetical protein
MTFNPTINLYEQQKLNLYYDRFCLELNSNFIGCASIFKKASPNLGHSHQVMETIGTIPFQYNPLSLISSIYGIWKGMKTKEKAFNFIKITNGNADKFANLVEMVAKHYVDIHKEYILDISFNTDDLLLYHGKFHNICSKVKENIAEKIGKESSILTAEEKLAVEHANLLIKAGEAGLFKSTQFIPDIMYSLMETVTPSHVLDNNNPYIVIGDYADDYSNL